MSIAVRRTIAVAVTGALAAAAPAAAALPRGAYKGRTDQNRVVSFTVKRGKIRHFKAGVLTFCTTQGNDHYETDAIANLPAIPIHGSRFHLVRRDPEHGQVKVVVRGRLRGSKVVGTVSLSRPDSYYDASDGMTYFGVCAANKRKFTASRG